MLDFRRTFLGAHRCWAGLIAVGELVDADAEQRVRELVESVVCRRRVRPAHLLRHARHEPAETCTRPSCRAQSSDPCQVTVIDRFVFVSAAASVAGMCRLRHAEGPWWSTLAIGVVFLLPECDEIKPKPKRTLRRFLQRTQCSHCKRCISYSNYVCLSVCPSVCPSHAGIVSKRRHVARCSLHRWIAKCV